MEQYLSIGDAAKRLGVVPATVKAMVGRGRLRPAARTEGGIKLFRPEDVERLAATRAPRARGTVVDADDQVAVENEVAS